MGDENIPRDSDSVKAGTSHRVLLRAGLGNRQDARRSISLSAPIEQRRQNHRFQLEKEERQERVSSHGKPGWR